MSTLDSAAATLRAVFPTKDVIVELRGARV